MSTLKSKQSRRFNNNEIFNYIYHLNFAVNLNTSKSIDYTLWHIDDYYYSMEQSQTNYIKHKTLAVNTNIQSKFIN